jgi:hypothetical protein
MISVFLLLPSRFDLDFKNQVRYDLQLLGCLLVRSTLGETARKGADIVFIEEDCELILTISSRRAFIALAGQGQG